MNSNTHNNRSNNLYFYSPAPLTPTYLIIQQPINSLQSPTTEDFERIIRQYQQYFFLFIEQQRHYPRPRT